MSTEAPENRTEKQALAGLAEIWERSKGAIMGRVDVLDQAAIALLEASLDVDLRRKAEGEAHKLTGSVGTFGFNEGSAMARQIKYLLQGESPLNQEQVLRLSELAVALRRVLEQPPTNRVVEQPATGREVEPAPKDERPLLLVATEDQELAHRLILEAGGRGLRGTAAANPESIKEVMSLERPDVVLLDQRCLLESVDGCDVLGELAACSPPVPVLLLASHDTFANRLEVARSGARRFLAGSLPPSEVLDAVLRTLLPLTTRNGPLRCSGTAHPLGG